MKQEDKELLLKDNQHQNVDLGLSVKWATCNVGATAPEQYGDYFAWGETETKDEYTDENCKTWDELISYISGDVRYDVARAKWGGSWRIPTKAEMEELIDKCQWEWTTVNEVKGYKVTGSNGNSIFLPAAGLRIFSNLNFVGFCGGYWSSTHNEALDYNAYSLHFSHMVHDVNWFNSIEGQTIRPVLDV